MYPIELSPRLRCVGTLVPPACRYADVGTDHAYLPVWLLQHRIIEHAVVSDIRPGPLARAKQTAARYSLTDRMEFRLCSGLTGYTPEDADTISIAGMGGETIASILSAFSWTAQGDRRWILQPMSAVEDLRTYLNRNGFTIQREDLVQEGSIIYVTLLAAPGHDTPYTPAELWAGRQRPGESGPLRTQYLERLLTRTKRIIKGLERSSAAKDALRRTHYEALVQELQEMQREWLAWQP